MRLRSSTATTWRPQGGRRPWPCALACSQRLHKCCFIYMNRSLMQQQTDVAQSTPTSVIAAAAVHAASIPTTTTATAAIREPRGARTPSQLADDLCHYATAAAAVGHRPDNDMFLAACLSELSAPHRLRRLRPRQLASLLRSLAALRAHPGDDWLADLDACCYSHPGPFDPASATAVLQALAALHTFASAPTAGAYSAPASDAPPGAPSAATAGWGSSSSAAHRATHHQQTRHRHNRPRGKPSQSFSSSPACSTATAARQSSSSSAATASSSGGGGSAAASFRFPQAVYLRLLHGGVHNYTYEQLAMLLQSFRSLGVAVSDELALAVGSRMATQLLEMGPEQRHRALAEVLGSAS